MLRFIVRIIGNAAALYLAFVLVPGFVVVGSWGHYLAAGFVLAVLNLIVRPILKLISFPLILLTLGLFTFVINMLVVWMLSHLVSFVQIESLVALFFATIITSLVNMIVSPISKHA